MGTQISYLEFPNLTRAEFLKEWEAKRQQDGYEYGHEMYSGSLVHVDNTEFAAKKFSNFKDAEAFLREAFVSKGHALVVQVGTPDERPTKLLKLAQAKAESEFSLKAFAVSIAYRTFTQKSKSRSCSQCECSFSKKGLSLYWTGMVKVMTKTPTEQDFAKLFDELAHRCEDDFEHRRMQREPLTSWFLRCPVCRTGDFLVTDTDKKKATSLKAKQVKFAQDYAQAHKDYLAKLKSSKKEHGWALLAATPC